MSQKAHRHQRKSLSEGKVHTVWRRSGMRGAKKEREFGYKMPQTSVPRWCNCISQLSAGGAALCFYEMDQTLHLEVALEGQVWTCLVQTWKRAHPFTHESPTMQEPASLTHPFLIDVKHTPLYLFTHIRNLWHTRSLHGAMPSDSRFSLLPRCQKDSPHLDLVWVSRAGKVPCTSGEERMWWGVGDKIKCTRKARSELLFRQL